jgi:hypothetical protein
MAANLMKPLSVIGIGAASGVWPVITRDCRVRDNPECANAAQTAGYTPALT